MCVCQWGYVSININEYTSTNVNTNVIIEGEIMEIKFSS